MTNVDRIFFFFLAELMWTTCYDYETIMLTFQMGFLFYNLIVYHHLKLK